MPGGGLLPERPRTASPEGTRGWARHTDLHPTSPGSPGRADISPGGQVHLEVLQQDKFASIPKVARRMCRRLMQRADRHCRNGELTVNEMKTFLRGTSYASFADWVARPRNMAKHDFDRDGTLKVSSS